MKVLKGFAIGLLTFLLFWSLSALGLGIMLQNTVLNPDFVIAELDKSDVYSLAKDEITRQLSQGEFNDPQVRAYLEPAVEQTVDELKPWIQEQVRNGIHITYDYLKGERDDLRIVIQLGTAKEIIRDNVWNAIQKSPPPELAGLPLEQFRDQFDQFYAEFARQIPDTFEVTENSLPVEYREPLQTARDYLKYSDTVFFLTIIVTIVLIAGIAALYRDVRLSTRGIGVTLVTAGALELASIFALKMLVLPRLLDTLPGGIPLGEVGDFLPVLINDILAPWQVFSILMLTVGAVLIVVSHVYHRRQPAY